MKHTLYLFDGKQYRINDSERLGIMNSLQTVKYFELNGSVIASSAVQRIEPDKAERNEFKEKQLEAPGGNMVSKEMKARVDEYVKSKFKNTLRKIT